MDVERGCVVVVRPDQYISAVLPLGEQSHGALNDFFSGFMLEQNRSNGANGHA